jgi:hypothetical protein
MKLNEIYTSNSSYFKPDDVKADPPILTIESVGTQTNKDKTTGEDYTQIVLNFVQSDKKLGLNFTNANTIAELLKSDDTDDWVGKTIELYATMVKVGAEQKLGIRVMPKLPAQVAFTPSEPKAEFTGTAPKVVNYDDDPDASIPF